MLSVNNLYSLINFFNALTSLQKRSLPNRLFSRAICNGAGWITQRWRKGMLIVRINDVLVVENAKIVSLVRLYCVAVTTGLFGAVD